MLEELDGGGEFLLSLLIRSSEEERERDCFLLLDIDLNSSDKI